MHFFISLFFIFISHYFFLFSFSKADYSLEDEALVAIAKGPTHFDEFLTTHGFTFAHINRLLSPKYETLIGILYFLRQNCQCVKENKAEIKVIGFLDKNGENACEKYHKQVFILYEYLFREYVGICVAADDTELAEKIPAVEKPIFLYNDYQENRIVQKEKTLIEVVKSLGVMWKFFFDKEYKKETKEKRGRTLEDYYKNYNKPHLSKEAEARLTSSYKLNFYDWFEQEDLLFKKELVLNSKFDNSYSRVRQEFDKNLKELWNKNEDTVKNDFKFRKFIEKFLQKENESYDIDTAVGIFNDSLFLTFINDKNKFKELCNALNKELFNKKELFKNIALLPNLKGNFDLEKAPEFLGNIYGVYLGIMHLMVEVWQCEKKVRGDLKECKEKRKYLDILYEYLLWVHNGAENFVMTEKFPSMRPNFHFNGQKIISILAVVNRLAEISAFFFDSEYKDSSYPGTLELMNKEKFINENVIEQKQQSDENNKKEQIGEDNSPKREETKKKIEGIFNRLLRRKEAKPEEQVGPSTKTGKGTEEKMINQKEAPKTTKQMESITNMGKGKAESSIIGLNLGKLVNSIKKGDEESSIGLDRKGFANWLKGMAQTKTITVKNKEQLEYNWLFLTAKQYDDTKIDDNYLLRKFLQKDDAEFAEVCKQAQGFITTMNFVTRRNDKSGDMVEYLKQQFAAYLGVVSLMKGKWKSKSVEMAKPLPAVIPIFNIADDKKIAFLIDVVDSLIEIWAFYFHKTRRELFSHNLQKLLDKCKCEPKLRNKEEVDYENPFGQNGIGKRVEQHNLEDHTEQKKQSEENKSEQKSIDSMKNTIDPNQAVIEKLRKEYDEMMDKMAKKAKDFSSAESSKDEKEKKFSSTEGFGQKKHLLKATLF